MDRVQAISRQRLDPTLCSGGRRDSSAAPIVFSVRIMSSQFVVLWDRTNEVGGFAHGWRIKDAVASHRCRVTSVLKVTLMEENYWYTGALSLSVGSP